MSKIYVIYCAILLALFCACGYCGYYPFASYDTMTGALAVKSIRNNPAAFRSFTSSGFTGK